MDLRSVGEPGIVYMTDAQELLCAEQLDSPVPDDLYYVMDVTLFTEEQVRMLLRSKPGRVVVYRPHPGGGAYRRCPPV